jgi:hypothetical protein
MWAEGRNPGLPVLITFPDFAVLHPGYSTRPFAAIWHKVWLSKVMGKNE